MIWVVGFGGILGTLARYYAGRWMMSHRRWTFPEGTWIINISGSFLLGLLYTLHTHASIPDWIWGLFGVGFCGAYTTFSTFGVEAISLLEQGRWKQSLFYVVSSVILSVAAAFGGSMLV